MAERTPAPNPDGVVPALHYETTYTHDPNRNLETVTNPLDERTRAGWSSTGDLLSTTLGDQPPAAERRTWSFTYTPGGDVETDRDPLGLGSTSTYVAGKLVESMDAAGHATTYEWQGGYLWKETDATGHVTTYAHHAPTTAASSSTGASTTTRSPARTTRTPAA